MGSLPAHPLLPFPLPSETVGLSHCLHGCSEYTCLLARQPHHTELDLLLLHSCWAIWGAVVILRSVNIATCILEGTYDGWTAVQVESRLGHIDQIPGLTLPILRDTHLGKAVNKLAKLGNVHPSSAACEQIASKARSSHDLHNALHVRQHRLDLCVMHMFLNKS